MNNSAQRINTLAEELGLRRYLEIGVLHGNTFRDVQIADRTAVDISFAFDTDELANEHTRFHRMPSDDFFTVDPILPGYDLIFIDGMHTLEQAFRDFTSALVRTGPRCLILIDDTVPDDIYSMIKQPTNSYDLRKLDRAVGRGWQGDVFKVVFCIHDFFRTLNYRTIVGSGNPQTLVWRSKNSVREPIFDDMERISRMSYGEFHAHFNAMQPASEAEALALCISEIKAL